MSDLRTSFDEVPLIQNFVLAMILIPATSKSPGLPHEKEKEIGKEIGPTLTTARRPRQAKIETVMARSTA